MFTSCENSLTIALACNNHNAQHIHARPCSAIGHNTLLILNQVFGSPQEAEQSHMPLHLLHGLVKRLTFGSHRINQTALGALIGWQSFSCPIHWRCTYSRGEGGDSYVSSYILRTFHLIYVSVSTTPHPDPSFFICLSHLRWSCVKKRAGSRSLGHLFFFLAFDFLSV